MSLLDDVLHPLAVLAASALAFVAPDVLAADATSLRGAWRLEAYELAGGARPSDGVLLFESDHFGMVYTMDGANGSLSGRAHAGPVQVEGNVIRFGVQWWVEDVDGVARVAAGATSNTKMELDGDRLTLHFPNGAIQKLRRLPSPRQPQTTGLWNVRGVRVPGAAEIAASGLLLTAGGHFVLVYTEGESGKATRGYSAAGRIVDHALPVDRGIASVDGIGTVYVGGARNEWTLRGSGATRTLTDLADRTLALSR